MQNVSLPFKNTETLSLCFRHCQPFCLSLCQRHHPSSLRTEGRTSIHQGLSALQTITLEGLWYRRCRRTDWETNKRPPLKASPDSCSFTSVLQFLLYYTIVCDLWSCHGCVYVCVARAGKYESMWFSLTLVNI